MGDHREDYPPSSRSQGKLFAERQESVKKDVAEVLQARFAIIYGPA